MDNPCAHRGQPTPQPAPSTDDRPDPARSRPDIHIPPHPTSSADGAHPHHPQDLSLLLFFSLPRKRTTDPLWTRCRPAAARHPTGRDDTPAPEALRWAFAPTGSGRPGRPVPRIPAQRERSPHEVPGRTRCPGRRGRVGRAQPAGPTSGPGAGRRAGRGGRRRGRRPAGRVRVRLRDLGAGRAGRDDRRPRPGPGLRPAAGRHHQGAAVQAGRPGRRRLPGHDQLRQQPVQPADHAGRGLPAAAGHAAARRHGAGRPAGRGRRPGRGGRRPRRHAPDADRGPARDRRAPGSPWPPPTGSGWRCASWTGRPRTPSRRPRC